MGGKEEHQGGQGAGCRVSKGRELREAYGGQVSKGPKGLGLYEKYSGHHWRVLAGGS